MTETIEMTDAIQESVTRLESALSKITNPHGVDTNLESELAALGLPVPGDGIGLFRRHCQLDHHFGDFSNWGAFADVALRHVATGCRWPTVE
jgi:hypothetical protein